MCSRHTVSLDIGLSHPHTPGIIHDDAHTIALPSVCRYRLVIIAKVVEDLLCMKFMWLQCDAAGIARRVALVARPSLITLKSSSCTYLLTQVNMGHNQLSNIREIVAGLSQVILSAQLWLSLIFSLT